MTRATTKTFAFSFEVNNEFWKDQPGAAAEYVVISKQRIANQTWTRGPRGGVYLLVTEPSEWRQTQDGYGWHRNVTLYATTREGRYVRPSRAPVPITTMTLETITMPVVDGGVTLPDGSRVETDSPFVTVPVLA